MFKYVSLFEEQPDCFLWQLHHFTFPPATHKGSNLSMFLSRIAVFLFHSFVFYNSHPFGCEVLTHCDFHSDSPND